MDDAAYLRAVCWSPLDDGPRLVYADALDERGDAARAEFIRTQCELARLESDRGDDGRTWQSHELKRRDTLRRRERELRTDDNIISWLPLIKPWGAFLSAACASHVGPGDARCCNGPNPIAEVEFRRGFVAAVTLTTEHFFGGPCGRCEGNRLVRYYGGHGEEIVEDCPTCRDPKAGGGTGRVEGVAAVLFAAAPVTEIRLSDWEPLRYFDGWVLSRGSGGPEMTRHVIPPEVFDLIPAVQDRLDERPEAG
jgi:uncharacterized protein (TIGR02996 family)